jgi:hypothetical protein
MSVGSLLPTDDAQYPSELKMSATLWQRPNILQVIVCIPVHYCITPTGIGNMSG